MVADLTDMGVDLVAADPALLTIDQNKGVDG